jgi:hypothetical protein
MSIADELDELHTLSPADMMAAFNNVIEERLADNSVQVPALNEAQAKFASIEIDPRLRAIFATAIGTAIDWVAMTQPEICEQFAALARKVLAAITSKCRCIPRSTSRAANPNSFIVSIGNWLTACLA